MKNLFVYINPEKEFVAETSKLVKIQIDNSLELEWKPEDIMLATNFDYEYNGIKSIVVGDENYCHHTPSVSKTYTIISLFKLGFIKKDVLYWIHDIDNYQLNQIDENKIRKELGNNIFGIQDYGTTRSRLAGGSIFFYSDALSIFESIKKFADKHEIGEELSLQFISKENFQKLNVTYNFTHFNIRRTYGRAEKPIINIHFHPNKAMIDFFMYGKNKLNMVFMSEKLIKLFNKHGIK